LEYYLEHLVTDIELNKKLRILKPIAKSYLEKIKETFPEYTPHEIEHKYKVVENLSKLIPLELAKRMNKYEIYFLLCASYIHDIGMCKLPELGDQEQLTEFEKENIRNEHHIRINTLVENRPDIFGLEPQEASYIGKIAMGHRKVDLSSKIYRSYDAYKTNKINVPLLAAFLRLADELDMDYTRIPSFLYKHSFPDNKISKDEWNKHVSTLGVQYHDFPIIRVTAKCHDAAIHRKIMNSEKIIQSQLLDLPNYLDDYDKFEPKLFHKIEITIDKIGYSEPEIKLHFDPKIMMNLLMSKVLYKKESYAIRELIKNAIDTCMTRYELCKRESIIYTPKIKIELKNDHFKISDNGMGMSIEFVREHFTNIGYSYYRSTDFTRKKLNFTPLGELGIGMLSCFMISDILRIQTKANNSDSLHIEIEDLSDFLFVNTDTENKLNETGTIITLNLKNELINENNIFELAQTFARHVNIPIEVNGQEIKDIGFNPSLKFKDSPGLFDFDPYFYDIKLKNSDFEGTITLIGRKSTANKFVPFDDHSFISPQNFHLSMNGILVKDKIESHPSSIIPPWINKKFIMGEINFTSPEVTLSISRDEIIYDTNSSRISKKIGEIVIDEVKKLLCNSSIFDKVNINSFIEAYFFVTDNHMKSSEKNFDDDAIFVDTLDISDLEKMTKELYTFLCFDGSSIRELKYNEIINFKKKILSIYLMHALLIRYNPHFIRKFLDNFGDKNKQVYLFCRSYIEYTIINTLFGINPFDLPKLYKIKFETIEDKKLLSMGLSIGRIDNYEGKRPFEISRDSSNFRAFPTILINSANPFIKLLLTTIRNKDEQINKLVYKFFKEIKYPLKYQKIIRFQNSLLDLLVTKKIINKSDTKAYLFNPEDLSINI
jgi:hypothetical protein